jgi:hypothetical protein
LSATVGTKDAAEVNVEAFLSRCTLDIIGLGGFGYDFDTLSSGGNELAEAFETIFGRAEQPGFLDMLGVLLPGIQHLVRSSLFTHGTSTQAPEQPTARSRRLAHAMSVMRRIGTSLIAERKADAAYVVLSPARIR